MRVIRRSRARHAPLRRAEPGPADVADVADADGPDAEGEAEREPEGDAEAEGDEDAEAPAVTVTVVAGADVADPGAAGGAAPFAPTCCWSPSPPEDAHDQTINPSTPSTTASAPARRRQ
ncbi:MAG: hypothetical protein GEV03_22460 [Streptosporangiales bacterium]|nr:hypothetical protein [Streptosporangiales bacterium]